MYSVFNARCDIYRDTTTDDAYGGAITTGTIVYANQECRLDYYEPRMGDNRKQGIETEKTFSLYLHDNRQNMINLRENDYIHIISPAVHVYYNQKFTVRGVQYESVHRESRFGIIEATLTRFERSRTDASL